MTDLMTSIGTASIGTCQSPRLQPERWHHYAGAHLVLDCNPTQCIGAVQVTEPSLDLSSLRALTRLVLHNYPSR